jgi:hypothetical protein
LKQSNQERADATATFCWNGMKVLVQRFVRLLAPLLAITVLALVFTIVFRQVPKERAVHILNAAEAEKALSEGSRLKIALRPPQPVVVIVRDKNGEGFTATDGQTFLYRDIYSIRKGTTLSKHGYDWVVSRPLNRAEEVLSPGQTVTVGLRGHEPIEVKIARKGVDSFTTKDGQIIAYDEVSSVSTDIWLVERIGRTLATMPVFMLWACVDVLSSIWAQFGHP